MGMVKEVCKEPRSYLIQSEGREYRRNRRHILPVAEPLPEQSNNPNQLQFNTAVEGTPPIAERPKLIDRETSIAQEPIAQEPIAPMPTLSSGSPYQTRSGRISRPNPKYKD